jgi:mono/diheme cytochrome c family protein
MLNKKKWVLLFVAILFLFLLVLFNDIVTDPFVETSIERGEEIYINSCIQCHGGNGQARKLNTATTLNNQEFLTLATDQMLMEIISKGRKGTEMPAFHVDQGGTLKDEQISDVISYMRSWHKQDFVMETPNEITGDPYVGRVLYENNCLSCHGNGIGPEVVNQAFLGQVSNEFLWDTIAYGRSKTAMGPSLKGTGGVRQLEENEISSIVMYLRSLEN